MFVGLKHFIEKLLHLLVSERDSTKDLKFQSTYLFQLKLFLTLTLDWSFEIDSNSL